MLQIKNNINYKKAIMFTFEKLLNYNNTSIAWLQKKTDNKNTKLGYAIEKLSKPILKLLKPLSDLNEERDIKINDINSDNALTDPVTKRFIYDIVKDHKGDEVQKFAYTPETRKKKDIEIRTVIKKYESDLEILLSLRF